MKTVYLARHGEAEINVGPVWASDGDTGLTGLGRAQSERLAERLAELPIDIVFSSGMRRAKETAACVLASLGDVPHESWDILNERRLPSSIIGRPRTDPEALKIMSEYAQSFSTVGTRISEGDNFETLRERAKEVLPLLEQRPEKNILVVGHGFFFRMLVALMLYGASLTPEQFKPFIWGVRTTHAGLSILKYDPADPKGAWWLSVWNDHAHLA